MRNVVFVAPFPLETTKRFMRATAQVHGVRLLGVFQEAPPDSAGIGFEGFELVPDGLDAGAITAATRRLAARFGGIHRVIGVLEALQGPLAQVRAELGVPGEDVASAERFRDKSVMKDAFRAAGVPCARHKLLTGADDAVRFIQEVGYPIVIKPPSGVGCRSTYRVDDANSLRDVLAELSPSPHRVMLAEEFLRGEESTFETITLGGEPVFHSISRYLPGPLEVLRNPWIQYVVHLPRNIWSPQYDDIRRVGVAAIKALGMRDGVTHMEWFRRPDGSLAIGEVAMRPPGVHLVRMMGLAYDTDFYRVWARAVIDGAWDGPWDRQYSVGCAFLRGTGRGRVSRVDGVQEVERALGWLVAEARLPQVGMPKADGYEGEGYVIVKHPDDTVVQRALKTIIETIRVHYS